MTDNQPLRALALNCTLKSSPNPSSTDLLAQQVLDALSEHDVAGHVVRVADFDVRPGVLTDMGEGDQWPQLREQLQASDILILATPTWIGHMSSIAQRVLERLDAELSETDPQGRPSMFGKVATAVVVGNEDGAHKVVADTFQALNDIGFSIPAQGCVYWNAEAMTGTDYNDLDSTPKAVESTTATLAANAAHLARLLQANQYPAS